MHLNERFTKNYLHKRIPLQAWMGASAIQVTSIFIVILFLSFATIAQTPVITTIAGSNMFTFYTPANDTVAQLYNPTGVALDGKGNLYIADAANQAIRKVNLQTNVISLFAGNGNIGKSGDGGPATAASIHLQSGFDNTYGIYIQGNIAADSLGNIYIADADNGIIRKVDTSGIITTIAGNGIYGYSGDDSVATNAKLIIPTSIAIDHKNNLYIADPANSVVRKVNPSGIISTFAGMRAFGYSGDGGYATNAKLEDPFGVYADVNNNIYISDYSGYVRKVDTLGIITTFAGDSANIVPNDEVPATACKLKTPIGVVADKWGRIYIDEYGEDKIRRVDTNGIISSITPGYNSGTIYNVGDGGNATAAYIAFPYGMAIDTAGNLYFCDHINQRVRVIYPNNIIKTVAGNSCFGGNGGQATNALINEPSLVTTDKNGNIYFSDLKNNVIEEINPAGIITTIAGNTSITNFSNKNNVPATSVQLTLSDGLVSDTEGNIFFTDSHFNFLRKVDHATGLISTFAGGGTKDSFGYAATASVLVDIGGLSIDEFGNLYIIENSRVCKVDAQSNILTLVAGGSRTYVEGGIATAVSLGNPAYITIDNKQNIYIADFQADVIRKVDKSNGIVTTFAGSLDSCQWSVPFTNGIPATAASICNIDGLATDDSGNVYVSTNNQLFKINTADNIVSIIGGNGNIGKTGNNGPADSASFDNIGGICLNKSGDLILVDQGNRAIRKINLGTYDTASTNSGNGNTTKGLTLYPNPSNGNFVIAGLVDSNTNGHVVEVVVDDVLGRELYRTRGKAANNYINIPVSLNQSVANGIYYCYIRGGDVNTTVKVRVMR